MQKSIEKLTFVGRPFPDSLMDEQKTFTASNNQIENDSEFQKFLKDNQLENKRTSMIVFGPENFMYWYGVLVDKDVQIPKTLMKFELPAAEVAVEEENAQLNTFNTPLNFVTTNFFKKIGDEGIEIYENPGDSETPYLIQDLDLNNKKLSKMWYLKAK